jgi:glutathione S-transferase
MKLYDLAGADPAHRFSPYCWRIRLALAHKGIEVETIPWRFTDKQVIAFSGQAKVPVLVDGDTVICDSARIADYLEDHFPDRPSLFGGSAGRALTNFFSTWAGNVMHPVIARSVVSDVVNELTADDQVYFRKSREAAFGMTLEQVTADREARLPAFRQSLAPLRMVLEQQPFLGGAAPLYADYIVFSAFQWARVTSRLELIGTDDPIHAWRERLLDAFNGLARSAPCYPR